MKKTQIERLQDAVEAFWNTQEKYAKYGASDSEPTHIFNEIMIKTCDAAFITEQIEFIDWDLYTQSMACDKAHAALCDKAKKCVDIINNTKIKDMDAIRSYINSFV